MNPADSHIRHCGLAGCERPLFDPAAAATTPEVLHRCALHEIASYNQAELREWGEENAADMVAYARRQLAVEDPMALVPGEDY